MTVAMRDGSGIKYLLTDHLGSVVAVTSSTGTLISQQRYMPFGEVRELSGSARISETDYGYTGQRALGMGLMDYTARFYDSALGRFIQADTVISNFAQPHKLNRYSYVANSPLGYVDSSGHDAAPPINPVAVLQAAVTWAIQNGYRIVGEPLSKDINMNGFDFVGIKIAEPGTVGVFEVKGTTKPSINLGTLNILKDGTRQMSEEWIETNTRRFLESENATLRAESQAVAEADSVTTIVVTNAARVSQGIKRFVNTVVTDVLSDVPTVSNSMDMIAGGGMSPRMRDMLK